MENKRPSRIDLVVADIDMRMYELAISLSELESVGSGILERYIISAWRLGFADAQNDQDGPQNLMHEHGYRSTQIELPVWALVPDGQPADSDILENVALQLRRNGGDELPIGDVLYEDALKFMRAAYGSGYVTGYSLFRRYGGQ